MHASGSTTHERRLDYPGFTRRQGRWIVFELAGNDVFLVDSISAEIRADTVRLWIATKHARDTGTSDPKWKSKALYQTNCKDGTLRTLESIVYDDQGNVERDYTKPSDISYPAPETIGEAIYGIACNPTSF